MNDRMKPIKFGQKPFEVTIYEAVNRKSWIIYFIVWYKPVIRIRGDLRWVDRWRKQQRALADKNEAIRYAKKICSKLMVLGDAEAT
jgi:hypothetical protein